jgi:ribosomal protein L37AE/L43A
MSNTWPFGDPYTGFQVLVCPLCSNELVFFAVPLQNQQIWKCGKCGNSSSLKLTAPCQENVILN